MKKATKNKIIAAVTSVAAVGTALAVIIPMLAPTVSAVTRLYGIQQLVDKMAENDFSILEIVPDHAYSSFGFLAGGSEPDVDEKLFISNETRSERESAAVNSLSGVTDYLEGGVSGATYSERLYTFEEDTYSTATFAAGHHEIRRGYFREALGTEKGSFTCSPRVTVSQYLSEAVRDGISLPTSGFIPVPGDVLTFVASIRTNDAVSAHSYKIEKTNAGGILSVYDADYGTAISVASDGSFSLTSNENTARIIMMYTVSGNDSGKAVTLNIVSDGTYRSEKATIRVPDSSNVIPTVIKASARRNGTVETGIAVQDSWQNGSVWVYNFRIDVTNNGTEAIHSWSITLDDPEELGMEILNAWNINWYTADGNLYISDDGNGSGNIPAGAENYGTIAGFQANFDTKPTDEQLASLVRSSEYYTVEVTADLGSEQAELPISLFVSGGERTYNLAYSAKTCSAVSEVRLNETITEFGCEISVMNNVFYISIPFGDNETETISTSVVTSGGEYTTEDPVNDVSNVDYVADENGTFVWIDDDSYDEFDISFNKLYYSVRCSSSNAFAKKVLELDDEDSARISRVKVISLTPTELEQKLVLNEMALSDIGLIYISNSSVFDLPDGIEYGSYDGTNDISWQTCCNILDNVVNAGMPVIIDRSIMNDKSSGFAAAKTGMIGGNNILRLCYLLRYYLFTQDMIIDLRAENTVWDTSYADVLASATVGGKTVSYGDYGAVSVNVFINGSSDNVLKCGFDTAIDTWSSVNVSSTKLVGFNEIGSEIENDAFFSNSGVTGGSKVIEYDSERESVTVWYKTILKYILNYSQRRLLIYKDTIKILDIEPTKYSKLSESMIKTWLGGDNLSGRKYEITQMSTYEFVGKIESLIENYDMIYIGSCIGANNAKGSMYQDSNGKTKYNDTSMNGLIYTHVGDKYTIKYDSSMGLRHKGLLDLDYPLKTSTNLTTRFSGNDLTEAKANELIEYALSGYPIVVSSELISSTGNTVNSSAVDTSSYMYKFLSSVYGSKNGSTYTYVSRDIDGRKVTQTIVYNTLKNVVKQENGNISGLIKYVNMPRLSIALVDRPLDYSITTDNNGYISTVNYMQKTGNKYVLSYTFEISNSSETNPRDTYYKVRLYTDVNADGKFSETEELDGLTVTDASTFADVDFDKLKTGVLYTATRELPDDYVGMTPWKLVVELNDSSLFVPKASQVGYTAIKAESTATVKVIQIKGSDSGCLDLSTNSTFKNLFNNVRTKMGYDVKITTVSASGIVSEYNKTENGRKKYSGAEDFYSKYLDQYDMLILGFQDCFDDIDSDDVTEAIVMFINSGKSVLFSHDTTSAFNATKAEIKNIGVDTNSIYHFWGYHMNTFVRPLVGMDRFGITNDSMRNKLKGLGSDVSAESTISSIVKTAEDNHLDVAWLKNGNVSNLTHGFNNYDLLMYGAGTTGNNHVLNFGSVSNYQNAERVTKISQTNEGQLTNYPYNINKGIETQRESVTGGYFGEKVKTTLSIATTHAQYYQLNLATDSDNDGIGDLVVWYCLSGGDVYDSLPNDVSNGYYIYSMGNILYTGMGHSGNSVNLDEAKLFVNTIVAAYHSGIKAPKVTIVKSEETKSVTLKYIYRTFDGVENVEAKDETFALSVKDNNIVNAARNIEFDVYKEVSSSGTDVREIQFNGETVYLKKLTSSELAAAFGDDFSTGIIRNGQFVDITVKSDWINEQMRAVMSEETGEDESDGTFRIFIGARTELTYKNYDGTTGLVKYTDDAFDCLTFKSRSLYDMD